MIKPLRDNIVIKEQEVESKKGDFYIPDSAKETPLLAEVLAVGKDVKDIEVGDTVIYKKFSTTKFNDVLIISEEDVLCINK